MEEMSVNVLKNICKKKRIPNISKYNKADLINELKKYYATIKIQRFFRSKNKIEQICPICFETTKNTPYFAFKPSGQSNFIYYNLNCLSDYLISSGDFRDPKTRELYSDNTLQNIDKEVKKHKIKLKYNFKSIYKASKNKKFYKNIKDTEESILIIERCLDDIIVSMKSIIENKESRRGSYKYTLQCILFTTFDSYYSKLIFYSPNSSMLLLDRTIVSIINSNISDDDSEGMNVKDIVLNFLYQLKFGD